MQVEVQVVQRHQAQSEDFVGFDQVAQITAHKISTGVAVASFFDGTLVHGELRVL
jgi:hypothetical protein